MGYYQRIVGQGHADQVWQIEKHEAVLLGVTNPQGGPGSYLRADQGESIWDAVDRQGWSKDSFHKIELGPRQYYPRIARPLTYTRQKEYTRSPSATAEPNVVALGLGQANSLMRRLDLICQTIHPAPENLNAYGHEIRSLLILAATEVEAHWRGILVANGAKETRFSTKDYVRLLTPMRLDGYAVSFPSFPWLAALAPFSGWTSEQPTQSLRWYDAYNQTKHDREEAFQVATLEQAFCAVSACVIMLSAQFTRSLGLGGRSDLSVYFRFDRIPDWKPDEIYCDYTAGGHDWTAVPHPALANV